MSEQGDSSKLQHESPEKNRFQLELEFVSCLANPWYLNNLAQNGYFEDPTFMNYIKYLNYWQRPEYSKFIVYPHALYFLDLLQNPSFRENLKNFENTRQISHKQYYHWFNWRNLMDNNTNNNENTNFNIKNENINNINNNNNENINMNNNNNNNMNMNDDDIINIKIEEEGNGLISSSLLSNLTMIEKSNGQFSI
ncbi:6192_t:CDS:2 [Diversispora eburnea]|uniref:Mediator of RNA polymerase II transcription subunit 31 n=1 Tax=Diversispora eburnea TaxID=1213867 RepID=A0A9N9F1J7_9GLOM|nr:6192_t:CDS:2 [Diversispora eburnea]